MLTDFFKHEFRKHFSYALSESQSAALDKLATFITSHEVNEVFLLKGYAGTGKTYLMATLIRLLKQFEQKSVLLAPTGRAAKVLSAYAATPAYTIHKKIYRQQTSSDGFGRFTLDRNLHRDTIFIVDEASMISNQGVQNSQFGTGRLLDDLMEFVYANQHNCRLILVGDTAQLPPVGFELSPALEKNTLAEFYLRVIDTQLTQVIRQDAESGILFNATQVRNLLSDQAQAIPIPALKSEGFPDVHNITGQELIEELESSYGNFGLEETVVITRSNKRANRFNQGIRNTLLYREEEISTGDYLMVVKNNYHFADADSGIEFIANGDIAEIVRINAQEEQYGMRFADVTLKLVDYGDVELDAKIVLDTLHSDAAALSDKQNQDLFAKVSESYDIKQKRSRYKAVREDPYFNALQVKFAYAVTCHKAQGGQWCSVFIDQGYFTEDMMDRDYLRWLYTAITRATDRLYFVNFHKAFFPEENLD